MAAAPGHDEQPAMRPEAGGKRGTGRTSRLITHAINLQIAGRAVYIIGADRDHVRFLRNQLPARSTIRVETPDSAGNFEWQTMSLRGAHPNCVVLVDHFAIEKHFASLLSMLTAYDAHGTLPSDEQVSQPNPAPPPDHGNIICKGI